MRIYEHMMTKCVSIIPKHGLPFSHEKTKTPMDVTESGDDFLGAGGLSQSDAQHRMRSPDSIGFLSYTMIF